MSDGIQAGRSGEPRAQGASWTMPEIARPVRVWPAVVIVAAMWTAILIPPRLFPESVMVAFMSLVYGTFGAIALFGLWWIGGSRVSWRDRGIVGAAVAVGIGAAAFLGHASMGFMIVFYLAPILLTALAGWLLVTGGLRWPTRRAGLVIIILGVFAASLGVRLEGTDGNFKAFWKPRWEKTQEDRFLAEREVVQAPSAASGPLTVRAGDWPEFRGSPQRRSIVEGVSIATDWDKNPPKLLWKKRVGPGWSSFAVVDGRAFTQEQRGPAEVVVCYDANTGKEIWTHEDPTRFMEALAGPGPRATPTFHDGKIYAQGANGTLNCLDARTGATVWSREIAKDSGSKIPQWGFSASPLVSSGIVTVYGGAKGKAVLAYDAATGAPLWEAGDGELTYCSTQLSTIDGVEQLLISTNEGALALDPKTGKQLWRHEWPLAGMARVVQPWVIGSDILIGTSFDIGTRRVHVEHDKDSWQTKEVWTSRAVKPYYNDFVVDDNHLYGFDGAFFTCVDLKDGKRKWRERGYGNGQTLLLADQKLLVILTETGEVALVAADPTGHRELARMDGLEGKTWNHPVVAEGKLFIRNGQEAACFELTPQSVAEDLPAAPKK